ncbi:hypothetical protein [Aquabacterium sp.]|uniref:hypothetical protein n=1 Tax=Aquabacterium sp. TaxID=1872578 RepID=UPI0025BC6DE0|nr:hypothetical protein [Aquabacterium sp.]
MRISHVTRAKLERQLNRTCTVASSNHDPNALPPHADGGQRLAVIAQALYLCNLLVAPGLAFLALLWLWFKHKDSAPPLARQHLAQATFVSVMGGILIVCITVGLIAMGGLHWPWTWVVVITYFVCIHGVLVLMGMFALAKAMAGQPWRYPLIGPRSRP